ncbi:carbohydrate kinase family protein [Helicovermis profundi]|uniref:Carbohydrate kinase n=1 Tax=Helicovermis profundi TaxID=3065157 RepID=A0AAU9E1N7_9FIRM|nr:carbohydrate kinase [Clostridia bacterium S502]
MDILAIGELLIDFTPSSNDIHKYSANPGGAPCNFLTMAANTGLETSFIGKVGDDSFGNYLKNIIEEKKIDTKGLILDPNYNTTLAFVHLNGNGERSFSFYRKDCADINLTTNEIDFKQIDKAKLVHFGSLSFTNEPLRSTTYSFLDYAKSKNKLITYDPNYRPSLWENVSLAKEQMLKGLSYCHILKVSDDELKLLSGETDLILGCEILAKYDIKLICVTLGEKGVFYFSKGFSGFVGGFNSKVIDTTGAGDTFFGALVSKFIINNMDINNINKSILIDSLKFANAAASICVENFGGIPSIPTNDQVNIRLSSNLISK